MMAAFMFAAGKSADIIAMFVVDGFMASTTVFPRHSQDQIRSWTSGTALVAALGLVDIIIVQDPGGLDHGILCTPEFMTI